MTPRGRRAAIALLAASLLLAACGDDDTEAADDTTTSTASTVSDETTTTAADTSATTSAPAEDGTVVEITVSGGEVTGGGRHEIPLGEPVVLRVTSDVPDEIHLHGYDLYLDLEAGQPGELRFDATIPGIFEAELHDSGIVLAELQIQ